MEKFLKKTNQKQHINPIEKLGFQCCFCSLGINEDTTDPLDINIVTNENMQNGSRTSQNFYSHFDCFKNTLHHNVQGYLVKFDDD